MLSFVFVINGCHNNNSQDSNSAINLIFLHAESEKFNNHQISSNLQGPSDHAPSLVSIIEEKIVQERKQTIVKDNEEEKEFINELMIKISDINMTNIAIYY